MKTKAEATTDEKSGNGGDSGCNEGSCFKVLGNNQRNNTVDGNIKSGKNIRDPRSKILVIEIDSNVTKMRTNKGVSEKKNNFKF